MSSLAIEAVAGQGSASPLPPADRPAAELGAADVPDDLANLDETARFFRVSVPTVRAWIARQENPCPVHERGANGVPYKLSLRAVASWRRDVTTAEREADEDRERQFGQLRLELLGEGSLTAKLDAVTGPLTPQMRAAAVQAELAATKLAELRRELVPADGVQLALAGAFSRIGAAVRGIPDRVQRELALDERAAVAVRGLIDDILHALADELEEFRPENLGGEHAAH